MLRAVSGGVVSKMGQNGAKWGKMGGFRPDKLDAWCGEMPAADSAFARRCYQVGVTGVLRR